MSEKGRTPLAEPLSLRFDRALELAVDLHRMQPRKGTQVPYVAHLLAVTALVLEHGGSEDQAIAALLHDAVEDQGGERTRQRIRQEFGDAVTDIVDACTDGVPGAGGAKPPWRARKERYVAHLADAPPSALLVSLADKVHNARAIVADHRAEGDAVWARFNPEAGRDGVAWYYRALHDAFAARAEVNRRLLGEFARAVAELEARARGEG